jgi:PAS domain S-box-containing protein
LRYLNKAGLGFFGFESNESIQGLHAYDLHPAFMKELLYDGIIPLVRKNGSWRGENWIENRAGNRIPVSQVITYHPDLNENYAFSTIMRDISDTKLKEQELKKSHEMYQNLAEASQDMILIIDSQYCIQYINQTGSKMIGTTSEEVVGKSCFSVPGMPVRESDISLIDSILASTKPKYIEAQVLFPVGSRWMGTWLVPIQDDQCDYSSILAICRDITHLKQTEEQLSYSLSRERELGELKSRFISLVSHEFRTPLATILSSVELLETYGIHWGNEKRTHHTQRIKNTVQSLDKLLDDILLIGRKDVGILPFRPIEINPIEVCTQIIQDMILTDHRKHQIRFSVTGTCESALMDPNLLRHILVNLLSNAVKFSYLEGKIDVTLECLPKELKIAIKDEGIGIPAEDLDQLYEPFNRGRNATNIPGSGLGLTIVKNSIDLCGGTIDIESKQYEGTTIRFTIPFAEKAFSE